MYVLQYSTSTSTYAFDSKRAVPTDMNEVGHG